MSQESSCEGRKRALFPSRYLFLDETYTGCRHGLTGFASSSRAAPPNKCRHKGPCPGRGAMRRMPRPVLWASGRAPLWVLVMLGFAAAEWATTPAYTSSELAKSFQTHVITVVHLQTLQDILHFSERCQRNKPQTTISGLVVSRRMMYTDRYRNEHIYIYI